MSTSIKIIVASPPETAEIAAKSGFPVANMIYRIGRGYHLYRAHGTSNVKNGLMVVETAGFLGGGPGTALISGILTECKRYGFSGIVLDTLGGASPPQVSLCNMLSAVLSEAGMPLFVPKAIGTPDSYPIVMLPTALSGGTLTGHLNDAVKKYGAKHVALEIELVRMDFTLPASSGNGREMTAAELDALIRERAPQAFFSNDLCANYFTYRDKGGTHFVLYDNAATIRRKLAVAERLGIEYAFLFYPHVKDILNKLTTS